MRPRIVVLEDDEATRDVLSIILTGNQYEVVEFSSAEQKVSQNIGKVDLFLIDYHLPGMDGLRLCRALKSNPSTRLIPILLISADCYIRRQARNCGAGAAIDKPFSRLELLQEIKRLIGP
jgi:CheY-like chemotaxis protein